MFTQLWSNWAIACYSKATESVAIISREHPELRPVFLDFSELATISDIQRALQENGENADAFFAMYESL